MSDHVKKCKHCGAYSDGYFCSTEHMNSYHAHYDSRLEPPLKPLPVQFAAKPRIEQADFEAAVSNVMTKHADTFKRLAENDTAPTQARLTLPTDSAERKEVPMLSGCLRYFPAALVGVARISKAGNDKHNPGQEMHHARGKSSDHGDCILRHLADLQDLLASVERGAVNDGSLILTEASSLAWRALALSQELHERFGAPLAPGAKLPTTPPTGQS